MSSITTDRVPFSLGQRLSALGALLLLSLRQHIRGKRLLLLSLLYLIPVAIAAIFRRFHPDFDANVEQFEFILLLFLIPNAIVPMTALLYAAGMIQDEIEDQTLTYLLIRSFSKRSLYLVKLVAVFATSILLTVVFTTILCLVIYWGAPNLWGEIIPTRCARILSLLGLSLVAYCSIFAFLSLLVRRSLVLGIVYIVVLEGRISSIDFAARRLTVMYYFRVLAAHWLELPARVVNGWSLHLETDPGPGQCLLVLLGVSLAASIAAMQIFAGSEFRLKTPEGD